MGKAGREGEARELGVLIDSEGHHRVRVGPLAASPGPV